MSIRCIPWDCFLYTIYICYRIFSVEFCWTINQCIKVRCLALFYGVACLNEMFGFPSLRIRCYFIQFKCKGHISQTGVGLFQCAETSICSKCVLIGKLIGSCIYFMSIFIIFTIDRFTGNESAILSLNYYRDRIVTEVICNTISSFWFFFRYAIRFYFLDFIHISAGILVSDRRENKLTFGIILDLYFIILSSTRFMSVNCFKLFLKFKLTFLN